MMYVCMYIHISKHIILHTLYKYACVYQRVFMKLYALILNASMCVYMYTFI